MGTFQDGPPVRRASPAHRRRRWFYVGAAIAAVAAVGAALALVPVSQGVSWTLTAPPPTLGLINYATVNYTFPGGSLVKTSWSTNCTDNLTYDISNSSSPVWGASEGNTSGQLNFTADGGPYSFSFGCSQVGALLKISANFVAPFL